MEILNCLGEFCPIPTLRVKSKVVQLKAGESLTVLVDHSCAVQNISETLQNSECLIQTKEVANGIWEMKITKTTVSAT